MTQYYRNLISKITLLTAAVSLFAACSVDDFISDKEDTQKKVNNFAFETSQDVMIDIDYGKLSGRALIQAFGENPLANATADDQRPKGNLLFSTFLEENGKFNGRVSLPTSIDHLYIYSPSWAAPQMTDVAIKNKMASVSVTGGSSFNTRAKIGSRAGGNLQVRKLTSEEVGTGQSAGNYYTIVGGWDAYGKMEDPNGLISDGTLTNQDIIDIQSYMWRGSTAKPSGLNNSHLLVDKVNLVVTDTYLDDDGVTQEVENAQVWFTFITEAAWNENTVGYYFYPKDTKPNLSTLKKYIILPSASIANHAPFGLPTGTHFFPNDKVPTKTNQRIQLLYVDDNGNASYDFPPGIEIGFFIIPNGFAEASVNGSEKTTYNNKTYIANRTAGRINVSKNPFYSNKELSNNTKHFSTISLRDGTHVYGVEDGTDQSCDDVMFAITATPTRALKSEANPPVIDQDIKEIFSIDKSQNFTYAFEDIWPNGGDYDMNDIIVYHTRSITYNQFNYVSKVEDSFRFYCDETTSAKDAFAIHISPEYAGTMDLPEGAYYEEETGSLFVTDDGHKLHNKTVTVTRTDMNGVRKADILADDPNPFIVNQSSGPSYKSANRIEIHMPKGKVTKKGKTVNDQVKAWYISDDGDYPYAVKLPISDFKPCDPGVRIGSKQGAYPNFIQWVKSLGQNYKDWYKQK